MLISEAKKICPNLVLVDGEDLTPFRDTSKVLFSFLKSFSWNKKAERLGFDEVFLGMSALLWLLIVLRSNRHRCYRYRRV